MLNEVPLTMTYSKFLTPASRLLLMLHSITEFLSESFDITLKAVGMLWDVAKDIVWVLPTEGDKRDVIFQ